MGEYCKRRREGSKGNLAWIFPSTSCAVDKEATHLLPGNCGRENEEIGCVEKIEMEDKHTILHNAKIALFRGNDSFQV